MVVLTFSRTYGCGVREIGRELAQELGYMYFEKELVPLIFKQLRLTKKEQRENASWADSISKPMIDFVCTTFPFISRGLLGEDLFADSLRQVITSLADKGDVVILGRGSQIILQDYPGAFHIRFIADLEYRIEHLRKFHGLENLTREAIKDNIQQQDKVRKEFIKYNFNRGIEDPKLYQLIIDISKTPAEKAKQLILDLIV